MHPVLFQSVPLYFVMWVCAAITALTLGTAVAAGTGFPARRSAVALALLALSILGGSKLLYLAEAYWFPFDDYVPVQARSSLHGFRIPGGMLALAAAMPVVCRALGLLWRRFGDAVIPLAALALVFIRVGCFLNGCCFGKVSGLPWAIAFPRGSWVFWYHRTQGWVPPTAQASLPVHPLQLYFLLAAVLTLATVLRQQRFPSPSPALLRERVGVRVPLCAEQPQRSLAGRIQLLFYVLFFATTAILEPLRENYLTLNQWLAPVAAAIAGGVLVGRALARNQVAALPATVTQ